MLQYTSCTVQYSTSELETQRESLTWPPPLCVTLPNMACCAVLFLYFYCLLQAFLHAYTHFSPVPLPQICYCELIKSILIKLKVMPWVPDELLCSLWSIIEYMRNNSDICISE